MNSRPCLRPPSSCGCRKREHSIGVSDSEMNTEIAMAIVTVTANSRKMRPTMPPISSSGMNTATSDTAIVTIVPPISPAPASAASKGFCPFSTCR